MTIKHFNNEILKNYLSLNSQLPLWTKCLYLIPEITPKGQVLLHSFIILHQLMLNSHQKLKNFWWLNFIQASSTHNQYCLLAPSDFTLYQISPIFFQWLKQKENYTGSMLHLTKNKSKMEHVLCLVRAN